MWTNDPFGYGSTVSYLFHLADVNRTAIQRIHHGVKERFFKEFLVPWVWQQSFGKRSFGFFSNTNPADTGLKNGVLTHLLPGAQYDIANMCGPTPSVCCQFYFKRLTTSYGCPGPRPVQITEKNVQER